MFSTLPKTNFNISFKFNLTSTKALNLDQSKILLLGKDLTLSFTTESWLLTTVKRDALENTEGKGENAGKQHFLLFSQCLLMYENEKLSF